MAESREVVWSLRLPELIKANLDVPTDIIFKIEEDYNKKKDVKAHQVVMALASEPFRKMLHNVSTNDNEAVEIVVKETTVAAFEAMVAAIYNTKSLIRSLQNKTVDEIFAILNLVKKYKIPELVLDSRDCLATLPLSKETMLEVASDAIKHLNKCDREAKELLLHCAKFLRPTFFDVKSVIKFIAANKEHAVAIAEVFSLMDIKQEVCDNCSKVPCKDGQVVTEEEFRLGLRVASNYSSRYNNRGTVDGIRQDWVKLKDCEAGGAQHLHLTPGEFHPVKKIGTYLFCFYCKTT